MRVTNGQAPQVSAGGCFGRASAKRLLWQFSLDHSGRGADDTGHEKLSAPSWFESLDRTFGQGRRRTQAGAPTCACCCDHSAKLLLICRRDPREPTPLVNAGRSKKRSGENNMVSCRRDQYFPAGAFQIPSSRANMSRSRIATRNTRPIVSAPYVATSSGMTDVRRPPPTIGLINGARMA